MKRLINAMIVAVLSAAFIFASSFLINNEPAFYEVSSRICAGWNIQDPIAIEKFCMLIRYLIMLTPIIWVYYFSVIIPRVKGWKMTSLIMSLLALVVGTFVAVLPVSNLYYEIFSKVVYWQVDLYRSRIPVLILNLVVCLAGLVLVAKKSFSSGSKSNGSLMAPGEFLKSCVRYGLVIVLAHLGLMAAVSLRGYLIEMRIENLPDYLVAAQADTKLLFGIIFLLIAEPLVHELAFRGLIFEHLQKGLPPILSAVFSSVLYAIWYEYAGLWIYAFLLGLLYCGVYKRTSRLRYAIVLHMLINLLRLNFLVSGDHFLTRFFDFICIWEKRLIIYTANNSTIVFAGSMIGICILVYFLKYIKAGQKK